MRVKGSTLLTIEEITRAKNYSAMGWSVRRVARELKRSPHAVKRVLTSSAEVVGEVEKIKANLADSFEGLAVRMVSSITDADIAKLDGYKKTLSGAIAADKAQLLRGLPTENVNVQVLLDVAHLIRSKREQVEDDFTHTIPVSAERILPAPSAEPVHTPAPAQSKAELHPPAPQPKIIYRPVPLHAPDDNADESPLLRGLPRR